MRNSIALTVFILALSVNHFCNGQDAPRRSRDEAKPAEITALPDKPWESYVVQLTEFRVKNSSDAKWESNDIVQKFEQREKDQDIEIVETIRLNALTGHESFVQMGKTVAVTTGFAQAQGRPPMRSMVNQEIGTLVRLTVEPLDQKLLLKLTYEATRFDEEDQEEASVNPADFSPPDKNSFQIKTMLVLEPGKLVLVGGSSAEPTSYLIVSLRKL